MTCASALPGKTGNTKSHLSLSVLVRCQNSSSRCLISSIFLTHDSFSYTAVWLPKSCSQCVQLGAIGGHGTGERKSTALQQLDCFARTKHRCAVFWVSSKSCDVFWDTVYKQPCNYSRMSMSVLIHNRTCGEVCEHSTASVVALGLHRK